MRPPTSNAQTPGDSFPLQQEHVVEWHLASNVTLLISRPMVLPIPGFVAGYWLISEAPQMRLILLCPGGTLMTWKHITLMGSPSLMDLLAHAHIWSFVASDFTRVN